MKKNIFYIILLISAGLFSSCEKFLDEQPVSQIGSGDFYSNDEEVNAGVTAIYVAARELANIEYALTEMRTDNAGTRTSEGEWAQFEFMNVDPTNASVNTYWRTAYNIIYQANNIMPYLENVQDETLKSQLSGEVFFLRAMAYFNLVRLYGDVPLVDKVVSPEEAKEYSNRVAASTVYTSIQSDLSNAVSMLQSKSDVTKGKATKGAAEALLAKVYLTQGNHSSALPLLSSVISEYAWDADYNNVFFGTSDAVIFAYEYIRGDETNGEDFSYAMSPKGRAGGLNWPTSSLFASIDTTGLANDGNGVDLRSATLFSWADAAGSTGDWQCGKFADEDNLEFAGNSWVVLRLADVYLMYCEAVLGNAASTSDATALGYINAVRSRAGLADLASITPANLLLERRVELAFENHRLFDLIRFGEADAALGAFAAGEGGFAYDTRDLLLPIPQSELAIYDMGQNPGY